jgi:hypothetical protein
MATVELYGEIPAQDLIEANAPLMAAIGRVTVRWAAVDLQMVAILAAVLGNKPAAQSIIFGGSGAGLQRFDTFLGVIGQSRLDQPSREKVFNIVLELKSIYGERNRIAHGPLGLEVSVDGNAVSLSLTRSDRDGDPKPTSLEKVDSHLTKVGELLQRLRGLSLRFG